MISVGPFEVTLQTGKLIVILWKYSLLKWQTKFVTQIDAFDSVEFCEQNSLILKLSLSFWISLPLISIWSCWCSWWCSEWQWKLCKNKPPYLKTSTPPIAITSRVISKRRLWKANDDYFVVHKFTYWVILQQSMIVSSTIVKLK